jgi:hypothetical protein
MSDIDLDAIRAREQAATPGPWRWRGNTDHDDPILVGAKDVLGIIPRERKRDDRESMKYAEYLGDCFIRDDDGNDRPYTDAEIEEQVRKEFLEDPWECPRHDGRMAFYGEPGPIYHYARDLAIYEVCPEATDRDDPRVYRADISGLRDPNAIFIAHARQDVADLLAEIEQAPTYEWVTDYNGEAVYMTPEGTIRFVAPTLDPVPDDWRRLYVREGS